MCHSGEKNVSAVCFHLFSKRTRSTELLLENHPQVLEGCHLLAFFSSMEDKANSQHPSTSILANKDIFIYPYK